MEPSEIPGYFYDAQKKKYFKIEKHDLPDFVTHGSVSSHCASNQAAQCAKRIRDSVQSPVSTNFCFLLSQSERCGYSSVRHMASDYSRMHLHHLRSQSSFNVHPISHCLLSPTGSHLHASSPDLLTCYEFFWSKPDEGREKSKPVKKKRKDSKNFPTAYAGHFLVRNIIFASIPGIMVQDMLWNQSRQEILALCGILSEKSVLSITLQDTTTGLQYNLQPKRGIRLLHSGSAKFVHPLTFPGEVSYDSSVPHVDPFFEDGTVLIWTRYGFYRIGDGICYPLYTIYDKKNVRMQPKLHITACSQSSFDSLHDSGIQLYLSTSSNLEGRKLCLVQMSTSRSERQHTLINFGNSAYLDMDVTYVHPLVSRSNNRLGILTRSLSGKMHLWDDRWPQKPVLMYRGSDCDRLYSLASHVVPQPVFDIDALNCVACPLPASGYIALWDIWSGNPINLLELTDQQNRLPSSPPPLVFLRSSWPSFTGEAIRGPGALAIDHTIMQWFYAC